MTQPKFSSPKMTFAVLNRHPFFPSANDCSAKTAAAPGDQSVVRD